MGMNKALVGKEYPVMEFEVNAKDFTYYAVGSNDVSNPYYWDESREGGIIAPPMFAVVYGGICIPGVIFDKELGMNVFLMVHGEEDIRYYKPVKGGMKIKSQAKIVGILDKGSGELCQFTVTSRDQSGEKVAEALTGFFVRGGGSGKKEEKKPEPAPGKTIFESKMKVMEKQTYVYAWASGDHNFIHVNPKMAVEVGKLPGIILQGLCSMAFCQNAVIDNCCKDRNPALLKRLAVRFAKPVFPKDELTITGFEMPGAPAGTIGFEAKRPDGTAVVKNGIAELG